MLNRSTHIKINTESLTNVNCKLFKTSPMWHPCTDPGYWLPRAAGRWPTGCRAGGSSAGGDPPPWWRSGPHWPPPAPPPPPSPPQGETSWSHQCVATIYMLGLTILKTCRHDVKMLIIVWYSWIVMVVARSRLEWCWGQQNNGGRAPLDTSSRQRCTALQSTLMVFIRHSALRNHNGGI